MARARSGRLGNMVGIVRLMTHSADPLTDSVEHRRRLLAEICRLLGSHYSSKAYQGPGASLSPRLRQTLGRLLVGDSEKQIARHLGVSPHTVHVYVKRLYRHYKVCSRGELLALFVRNASGS